MDFIDDLSLSQVKVTVPTTSTFLLSFFFFTFFVNVHLRFELIFFFKGKISYLTALNYCNIVSNDRAVPCMCLGSRLH